MVLEPQSIAESAEDASSRVGTACRCGCGRESDVYDERCWQAGACQRSSRGLKLGQGYFWRWRRARRRIRYGTDSATITMTNNMVIPFIVISPQAIRQDSRPATVRA